MNSVELPLENITKEDVIYLTKIINIVGNNVSSEEIALLEKILNITNSLKLEYKLLIHLRCISSAATKYLSDQYKQLENQPEILVINSPRTLKNKYTYFDQYLLLEEIKGNTPYDSLYKPFIYQIAKNSNTMAVIRYKDNKIYSNIIYKNVTKYYELSKNYPIYKVEIVQFSDTSRKVCKTFILQCLELCDFRKLEVIKPNLLNSFLIMLAGDLEDNSRSNSKQIQELLKLFYKSNVDFSQNFSDKYPTNPIIASIYANNTFMFKELIQYISPNDMNQYMVPFLLKIKYWGAIVYIL